MIVYDRARSTDIATSHEAGRHAERFVRNHCDRIYFALVTYGPMTIHELASATGLTAVSVARRMLELGADVRRTAERRNSPSGRACAVWMGVV